MRSRTPPCQPPFEASHASGRAGLPVASPVCERTASVRSNGAGEAHWPTACLQTLGLRTCIPRRRSKKKVMSPRLLPLPSLRRASCAGSRSEAFGLPRGGAYEEVIGHRRRLLHQCLRDVAVEHWAADVATAAAVACRAWPKRHQKEASSPWHPRLESSRSNWNEASSPQASLTPPRARRQSARTHPQGSYQWRSH